MNKHPRKLLSGLWSRFNAAMLAILIMTAISMNVSAEIVGVYDFSGNLGTELSEPGVAINSGSGRLVFGSMSRGSGLTASVASGRLNSIGFTTGGLDINDYYGFMITPLTGNSLTIDRIQFAQVRSANGPRNYTLRSSLDGFVSDLVSSALPNSDLFTQQITWTFSPVIGPLRNIGTETELRIYGFNSILDSGIWGIGANNDPFPGAPGFTYNTLGFPSTLTISGTVNAIPEPNSFLLLACAVAIYSGRKVRTIRSKTNKMLDRSPRRSLSI